MEKIKIKNMFWDESRYHATDGIDLDLTNGRTVGIRKGDDINKIIKKLESVKGGK